MSASRKPGKRSSELVKAGDLPFVAELAQDIEQCIIENEIIRSEDIAYTHSIFLQCFLPLRHRPSNVRRWETGNRLAKLVIRAGELVNPNSPGTFRECAVPAGPKARLLVTYINDYAFRHKTPLIPLGESLREAMRKMNIAVGGKNGKELHRELENIAAAEINLGIWAPDGSSAHQKKASVAEELSFWMEKDSQQRTLWQPEMLLSTQYYRALSTGGHIAPLHWEAYIALQHNARAMDIFTFLSYRLRSPLKQPVLLHASVLHSMFGRDIKHLRHFWPEFVKALKESLKWYPSARVEILNDGIKLYNSQPLIPYRKMAQI
jgi:hypothetical protein